MPDENRRYNLENGQYSVRAILRPTLPPPAGAQNLVAFNPSPFVGHGNLLGNHRGFHGPRQQQYIRREIGLYAWVQDSSVLSNQNRVITVSIAKDNCSVEEVKAQLGAHEMVLLNENLQEVIESPETKKVDYWLPIARKFCCCSRDDFTA